jgi:hypothetical protein
MALMHWDYIDRLGKVPSGLPFKKISMMTTSTLLAKPTPQEKRNTNQIIAIKAHFDNQRECPL